MLAVEADENMELLTDRTIWGGMGGILASLGLAQWSHLGSLAAACFTCVFMGIRIYQVLKKP